MGRLSANSPSESACTTPRKRGVELQLSQDGTSRSSRSSGTLDGWPHTLHVYVGIRSDLGGPCDGLESFGFRVEPKKKNTREQALLTAETCAAPYWARVAVAGPNLEDLVPITPRYPERSPRRVVEQAVRTDESGHDRNVRPP